MALGVENERVVWITARRVHPLPTPILALVIAVTSYLAARLGGTLVLFPAAVSALWPACAFLASVLLAVPIRIWPVLIPSGLAGFILHDVQVGFPPRTIALFITADTIEILIATLCLRHIFDGIPLLNSLKALGKYCLFAVLLAPFVGAFVGALAIRGYYWTEWRIFFFSEALAFLTLPPALLSWLTLPLMQTRRSSGSWLEVAALTGGLVSLASVLFCLSWRTVPPALLYSLVPFLLWAALRFGSAGVSSSVIMVAFFAVWGGVHGRGPFAAPDSLGNVLSLQLFLVFAVTPFMVLAVLVEERRQARLVQRELGGRLISAQEDERRRIARELHDDICQRLALLSIELEQANRNEASTTKPRMAELRQHCAEIAGDVQSLSHQLHSSKLDYLGIVAAVKGLCGEFAQQHKVSVDFNDEDLPRHLPKDISLCLFRITQEALHNAVKYSGRTQFTVTLQKIANEVRLEVSDGGIGFDVERARRNRGLGLVSMQERVHLVHGTLSVTSAPGKGTRVLATVPIVEDVEATATAAGDEPAGLSGVVEDVEATATAGGTNPPV